MPIQGVFLRDVLNALRFVTLEYVLKLSFL